MNHNRYGNQDDQEKMRELSEAEQKRLESFELLSAEMLRQGYRRTELTVSIVKANVFAVILLIPVMAVGMGLFFLKNRQLTWHFGGRVFLLFLAVLAGLIVVHELIHGICWAVFAEHHWKDIEFGFMKQYLTPYCTCGVPLSKGQYIFGALTPMIVLGIIPLILGIVSGSMPVLMTGIIMTDAAAGDLMIVWNLLRYKSTADKYFYMDHPTQAGGVIFEKYN